MDDERYYLNDPVLERQKFTTEETLINNYEDRMISTFDKNNLKILTYNIWGVDNDDKLHFDKRMEKISDLLKNNDDPYDIVCLQEVSRLAYTYLESNDVFTNYNYISHEKGEIANNRKDNNNCCRDIDNIILSKDKLPISLLCYKLFSSKEYKYSIPLTIAVFNNLVVVNIHTISGIYNGIKRFYQLRHIYNIVEKINNNNSIPTILCGDFNFDLNTKHTDTEFPKYLANNFEYDIMQLNSLNEKHSYRTVELKENLYTEDTNKNFMRWNIKFAPKLYKYDGFIINDKINTINENLIGDTVFYVTDEDENKKIRINAEKNHSEPLGLVNEYDIPLFPSDHFGIVLTFSIKNVSEYQKKYIKYKKKYIKLKNILLKN